MPGKRGSRGLLVEGKGCRDLGTASANDPTQVEGRDVLAEAALSTDVLQKVPSPKQPFGHICKGGSFLTKTKAQLRKQDPKQDPTTTQ